MGTGMGGIPFLPRPRVGAVRRPCGARIVVLAALALLPAFPRVVLAQDGPGRGEGAEEEAVNTAETFSYPCQDYLKGLKGRGNFGILVSRRAAPPFGGTYHLAEDVWLEGGTEVRSVADGMVVYSDFSQTWTDDGGVKHWNLGNVVVIEHVLETAEKDLERVCSFYVHLGNDRKVKTGDRVEKSQLLGVIGADRSEENGGYPAHLHFGLHRGPYRQIPLSFEREVTAEARRNGLPVFQRIRVAGEKPPEVPPAGYELHKGEVESVRLGEGFLAEVRFKDSDKIAVISLLVESSSPRYRSAPIMCWCSGYGDKAAVSEWLKPSVWIRKHLKASKK